MANKKTKKESEVLLMIGETVRIIECDRLNVEVQRLETYYNPRVKENVEGWRFQGYSDSVISALGLIQRKRLLVEQKALNDLTDVLQAVRESDMKTGRAIAELKEVAN